MLLIVSRWFPHRYSKELLDYGHTISRQLATDVKFVFVPVIIVVMILVTFFQIVDCVQKKKEIHFKWTETQKYTQKYHGKKCTMKRRYKCEG